MALLDVIKELFEILTAAFGRGWGWMMLFLLMRALESLKRLEIGSIRQTWVSDSS
jgi:hypothetical protein